MTMQTEAPNLALARVVATLDERRAATLRESFGAMFDRAEEWQREARGLVVTAEDQKGKMQRARSLRLEIRAARVELDKRRKALKEGVLVEGRAIDGAFAIFRSLAEPVEEHLLVQETFAERAEAARRNALTFARAEALQALGVQPLAMPSALGEMSEEAWVVVLGDAKLAKAARDEQARQAEVARVEAARVAAEQEAQRRAEQAKADADRRAREDAQRQENERLRAELDAQQRAAAEERRQAGLTAMALDAQKAEAERQAAQAQAETRAATVAKQEADKAVADAQAMTAAKAQPESERYARAVAALRSIAACEDELRACTMARRTLRAIGEAR